MVVVGGGLAGLVAAWKLKHGVTAKVYGPRPMPAAACAELRDLRKNQRVERGGERSTAATHYKKLINQLGLKLECRQGAEEGHGGLRLVRRGGYSAQVAADFAGDTRR